MKLFDAFEDEETTQVLYGGAASGGKSYGLMALVTIKCLQFPGIRVLVGREELINLRRTTLKTLFKILAQWGLKKDMHFKYNQKTEEITFFNGSIIMLRQLKYEPSDPDVDSLGSLEITFAVIDEAPEVVEKVVNVLHSRCGRWENHKYKIKPMLFMTCNPSRGFCYSNFYRPSIKNKLKNFRKFIPATIDDNNAPGFKDYKKHLLTTLDFNDKQRLVFGKWEFDNDPNALIKFDNITRAYDFDKPSTLEGEGFITADIAFTSDKCILIRWAGFQVAEIREVLKDKERPEDVINKMKAEYNIRNKNICYDATGSGMYLKNYLPNSYVFHSGAKPIGKKQKEFEHLKTQCYYLLSELIMDEDSTFRIYDDNLKEELEEELLQIKTVPKEKMDDVIKMIKKDDIKKAIGRSPDILDALAMRMVYTVKTTYKRNF
jgi:hypothetical protein